MSESDADAGDDTAAEAETGGASQDAPNQSVQHQEQTSGGTSLEDFVSEGEQETIKDWLTFVGGAFFALAITLGIHFNIQTQWEHNLLSASGDAGGTQVGQFASALSGYHLQTIMLLGVVIVSLLGYVIAKHVDNSNNTAYKVAAVNAIVGLPLLVVVSGLFYAMALDDFHLELANTVVSGLGAGIAAAIGSGLVIWLTENQLPVELR